MALDRDECRSFGRMNRDLSQVSSRSVPSVV